MSNVIQFLASMGASAPMARMSMEEYEAAIATLDAGDRTLQALRRKDVKSLVDELSDRDTMMCMVFAPDEKEQEEVPGEEQEEKVPDDKSLE